MHGKHSDGLLHSRKRPLGVALPSQHWYHEATGKVAIHTSYIKTFFFLKKKKKKKKKIIFLKLS
jgi:hypothetical protein